ncbi:MAG: hypothetical protein JJT75_14710 [Opitutales bacterium]|nr:hypothetical protein [Opitutales bacterium]MCH8540084.1 hypothetical protein [Opitutales bacterium]
MEEAHLYLLLGTVDSSRERIVSDLIPTLSEDGAQTVNIYRAQSESDHALKQASAPEKDFPTVFPGTWQWKDDEIHLSPAPEKGPILLLGSSLEDPRDLLEKLPTLLDSLGLSLGRILTSVNCQLLHEKGSLRPWFEACIHFSDYVFLANRDGVPDKWIREYQKHFEKECYPCLFELLRKNGVKNPALVLHPEARRLSHFFDVSPDEVLQQLSDLPDDLPEIVYEGEDQEDPENEEETEEFAEDLYLRRNLSGRREITLPAMEKFLPHSSES